ncbi:MAG: hypothetical protein R2710_11790 [Acidimicrobiales bacterium]
MDTRSRPPSFGLSVSGTGFVGESLLRAADVALYRAKNLGRSHRGLYRHCQVEAACRSTMIEDLREASTPTGGGVVPADHQLRHGAHRLGRGARTLA